MTAELHEPTAVGWAMRRIVAALPEKLARDLHRLLSELIGADRGCELRELRLGLVFDMTYEHGEPPSTTDYDKERLRREASGEHWPERSGLAAHYGGWIAVQQAALDLYLHGNAARIAGGRRVREADRGSDAYEREEIIAALVRFHEKNGHWPANAEEYRMWAVVDRRAGAIRVRRARARVEKAGGDPASVPGVRVPGLAPIRRHFGRAGFTRAVSVAQRQSGPSE